MLHFRCHIFLRSCGNSLILLRQMGNDSTNASRDVLQVLSELLQGPVASAS